MCDNSEEIRDALQGCEETDSESGCIKFNGKIVYKSNGEILVAQENVGWISDDIITGEDTQSLNNNNNNSTKPHGGDDEESTSLQKAMKTPSRLAYYENVSSGSEVTSRVFCIHPLDGDPDHTKELISMVSSEVNLENAEESSSTSPFLMCLKCRVTFRAVTSFIIHVTNDHCVVTDDCELELLESKNTNAVLQQDENGRLRVSFLQPVALKMIDKSHTVGIMLKSSPSMMESSRVNSSTPVSSHTPQSPLATKEDMTSSSSRGSPLNEKYPSHAVAASLSTSQQTNMETLLSGVSSTDSMYPISLFQTRNSCKTLKCPKCNWHYKYRQTLEAHMKEKHFEETSDCVYCNASQPHPRLSRGESYSCGYKPFKCNVCNYSTTTKGNLSIHMQSDKHLYNARTLQQRQQDRIRQGVATPSTFQVPKQPTNEGTTNQNENMQQTSIKGSSSPGNSSKYRLYTEASIEKQSKRRRSSSKTSSSMDSGIFSVPSKTGSPTFGRRESSSGSGGKWRCDVCSYETGISRNLRIHMTSEKHAQNLALRERGLLNTSRNENEVNKDIKESSSKTSQLPDTGGSLQGLVEYYAAAFKSLQQNGEGGDSSVRSFSLPDDVEKARKAQAQYLQHKLFLAQQQQLILAQQYQQMMMAAAASLQQRMNSQSKEELPQLSQINSQQLMLQNSQNQLWKQLFPQVNTDLLLAQTTQPTPEKKIETSTSFFSCGLCGVYSSDDINCLEAHVRKPRHTDVTDLTNNEWVTRTRNREREGYFCKLCAYSTPLKTNFNLHCKTEKHTSKLSLISHVREGGTATEWMIPHIIRGSMTQNVSCNACQFATHSFEKLKLHCATDQHQGVQTVCQYLQSMLNAHVNQADGTGIYRFNCLACTDFATMHVVEMVRHMQTTEHQLQLQKQENPGMAKLQDVITIERQDSVPSMENSDSHKNNEVQEKVSARCDYCNYSTNDKDRLNLHVMTQHSGQPLATCPLCQEVVKSPLQLRIHLVEAHSLQVPPVESNINEDLSGVCKNNKKSDEDMNKKIIDEQKGEDIEDGNTLNSHGLVIDEEAGNKIQGGRVNEAVKNGTSTHAIDAEKSSTKHQMMGKNRSLDPNSLIMQVLKGNNGSSTNSFGLSEKKPLTFSKESTVFHEKTIHSRNENETNAVFLDTKPVETVSRSCPDLVSSVNKQMEYNNRPANFISSRSRTTERKTNRIRVRSCPLDEPRSRTYRRLLSDYGLEQARHYIENRSPHNRNKAKNFKTVKREQRWTSLTDDLDNDCQVSGKQALNEGDSAHSPSDSNLVFAKTSSGDNGMDVEEETEGSVRTCRHCGKDFTGLWVLKAHEEVAHGVYVSAGNIQSVAEAYSEQFQEKIKNVTNTEGLVKSVTQDDFNNNPLKSVAQSNLVHSFMPAADTKLLNTKSETTLSLAEQQVQQQALLQSIIKAQAMKQAGASETNTHVTNGLDGVVPAGFPEEQNPLSANLANQIGMYSAFLQAQAIGASPYQIFSNAAALQQLQHLAGASMLGQPDASINRVAKSSFSNSLSAPNIPSASSENQKSPTEKPEQQSHIDGNASMISSHVHARSSSLDIPLKRPRTRITDEQLKILRANFDINNSPSEQQIDDMAQSTSLPPKVIKHWFRNTLFKERQRSKDSPYNFNIPPITSLDDTVKTTQISREEATKKETQNLHSSTFIDDYNSSNIKSDLKSDDAGRPHHGGSIHEKENKALHFSSYSSTQRFSPSISSSEEKIKDDLKNQSPNLQTRQLPDFTNALSVVPSMSPLDHQPPSQERKDAEDKERRDVSSLNSLGHLPIQKQHFNPLANWQALTSYENSSNNDALFYENASSSDAMGIPNIQGSACRRTPRTRFTDFQLQVLQDFFDKNAYPKDDDLDRLSQTLSLSTRVIVVWFQNARQKARKSYEQQQQQQHGGHGRYSPSGEHERSSLKFEEHLSTAAPGVEDLARKTLNEVSKTILNENKMNVKGDLTKEMIEATQKEILLLPIKPDLENPMSQIKNTNAIPLPCQLCEKTFLSVEQWQKHQQDHLRANVASMFGQYGLMYMQGLVGTQEDQTKKHMENKPTVESSKVVAVKSEKDADFSPGSIEALQENMKRLDRKPEDSMEVAAFQSDKGLSMDNSMRSRVVTPSAGGSGKRKLSSSPTLSQTSPSSIPATSQSGSMRAKCSFMDDKEHMGMHKDPKRLRTTITPEQLEYLYQQYLVDSSPSRKIIEQISEVVGLKKRVVQVWFQNTRARERKGQFRSSISRCVTAQMNQYKLCPLCRMVFRSKEQYDVHVLTMHNQGNEPRTFDSEQPAEKKAKYSGYIGVENNNSNNSVNKESLSTKSTVHLKSAASEDEAVNLSAHVIKQQGLLRSTEPETQEQAFTSASTPVTVDYSALFASNPNHPESIQLQQKLASIYANSSVSVTVTPTQNNTTLAFGRDASEASEALQTSPTGISKEPMTVNQQTSTAQSLETNLPLNFSTHPHPSKTTDKNESAENIPCSSETSQSSAIEPQSANIMQLNETHDEMVHLSRQKLQVNNSDNDDTSTPTKRHRTQMSSSQVMALKHCFKVYKTPSLPECEELGRGIGLQKRVVQVWFQNARAKDKKRKLRSKVGADAVEIQSHDHDDRDDRPKECNICYPVVYYSSPQEARGHVFSPFHLQRLMKTVEGERRKEFLGFGTSQSSPCSSSDGTDNQVQDYFAGDTSSDQHSPDTRDQSASDAMEGNTTLNGRMSISLHDRIQPDFGENKSISSEGSRNPSGRSSSKELKLQTTGDTSDANQMGHSQLLQANPGLLQHYHQAVQQLMMASQQGSDVEGSVEQQALLQQAMQKSLYQMLKRPQTSPTGSQ